jgi:hypothetical protein
MRRTSWSEIVPIFILGFSIFTVFLLLSLAGYVGALSILFSILTPLTGFLLGAFGLWMFGRASEIKEGQIHTLYLWVSLGLLVLSLSEIAGILVNLSLSPLQIELTVGLVQIPGVLLWGFGIMQYLRSINLALEFSESWRLWIVLLTITSIAALGLVAINVLYYSWMGLVENIVFSPLVIGLTLFTAISLGFVWIFRHGEMARPLALNFIGFFLYLIRTVQWVFAASILGTPLNSIFALEAYVFFGAAFVLARSLGNPIMHARQHNSLSST